MRWPTTLRAQFVAVVAGAVILSNLAVIAILEVGREGELQVARRAAAVDRISAMFDYISTIPEEQRESATHTLSGTGLQLCAHRHAAFRGAGRHGGSRGLPRRSSRAN